MGILGAQEMIKKWRYIKLLYKNLDGLIFFDIINTVLSGSGSVVEHWLPKPRAAGSNPVFRSNVSKTLQGFAAFFLLGFFYALSLA